jgi:drug/metabolite transporter (DMT)-like permease
MNSAPAVTLWRGGIAAPLSALIVASIAMGCSPIFVRLAEVGPFTSAFWRVALALPVLYAWMRLSEHDQSRASVPFARATNLAGLAFTGDLIFWHLSIVTTSVANATFFATTAPVWVVIFGWLLLRKRASAGMLLGLGLCILGGAALLTRSVKLHTGSALGDIYGLITGVFFGLYFLAVQSARQTTSAARVTFEASLITAGLLLIVALVAENQPLPRTLRGLGALFALSWISHAGGQGLLAIVLGRLPAAFSSLVIFLEAVAAAALAWLILGEPVTIIQATGGLAILAGIYVARPSGSDMQHSDRAVS